jgi:DNA-directed RNA polymerase subunit beta'
MDKKIKDMFFGDVNNPKSDFNKMQISIASPELIYSWSHGVVKKHETINYRTLKPERGGLFCAQIFGPIKDNTCLCGKYKKLKHAGMICEKCGVEITSSSVRRERMGHIELVTPVVHVWFLRALPSRIGLLLDMTLKTLESIIYFENNVIVDSGMTEMAMGTVLSSQKTQEVMLEHGDEVSVSSGAEAIRKLLESLDLKEEIIKVHQALASTKSELKTRKLSKRLHILEAFINSKNKPEWMVLTNLPVIAPDLRPLVHLDGGRFASSDLNELYRRVINRNNRLKKLLTLKAPDIILCNEKRMLQEAVDALLDNSKTARVVLGANKRPLKSISDNIKGKRGRFRQNLLGKRVDYSGRSIITSGPNLKFYQCGLPKEMALELFKPFIYAELQNNGHGGTIKAVKDIVKNKESIVWEALDKIIHQHLVILNRAPTLHRLSMQAFEPILIEGKALQLHPLSCSPFNADFDGDSMAVHIPLSLEAQLEARVLMLSSNNILNPRDGECAITPTQDIVLGLYYASMERAGVKGCGNLYPNYTAVKQSYDCGILHLHARIKMKVGASIVSTTTGRVLLSQYLPVELAFSDINQLLIKSVIGKIISKCFNLLGKYRTVQFLDQLMSLGFHFSTQSGTSIGLKDMIMPSNRLSTIMATNEKTADLQEQYQQGLISAQERYNHTITLWVDANSRITKQLEKELAYDSSSGQIINPLYLMSHSGARGSISQLRQLSGMRGLMASPGGALIDTPITANFREGLTALQYFTATHGARKGLADTALKTASAGYLTRRLVDVAQDIVVNEQTCCGTTDGIMMKSINKDGMNIVPLGERILGRLCCDDIVLSESTMIPRGTLITDKEMTQISAHKLHSVKVRSPLKCRDPKKVCISCYGIDLATNQIVCTGEPVGIVAAQSISEPGTQLTLRTFHAGGASSASDTVASIVAEYTCTLRYRNIKAIQNANGQFIVLSRSAILELRDEKDVLLQEYNVSYGGLIYFADGATVQIGDSLALWNPNIHSVVTEASGFLQFEDMNNNPGVIDMLDTSTGLHSYRVIDPDTRSELRPRLCIVDTDGGLVNNNGKHAVYNLDPGSYVYLQSQAYVQAGDVIAIIRKDVLKEQDIVGGLPRIIELFEARKPKNPAVMVSMNGTITFGKEIRGKQKYTIQSLEEGDDTKVELLIPRAQRLNAFDGEQLHKGDLISEGSINPHDLLHIHGMDAAVDFIIDAIQNIYRSQGVKINDKHLEVVLKVMFSKVEITASQEPLFMNGDHVDRHKVEKHNQLLAFQNIPLIKYKPIIVGITKSSLSTDSFLAAASFQETTRILIDAAINGQIDNLTGFKENVLIGRLIPAGTSMKHIKQSIEHKLNLTAAEAVTLENML